MKTKYVITTIALIFLMFQSAEAQFLKKLQKRVEQKVENAVIEKAANKAAEKATSSMDKMFEVNPFGGGSKEKADPSLVADSYNFSWKYSLKMSTKEGAIVFDYYLQPDASYFGFTTATMEKMFTVMDNGQKIMVMFMPSGDNNIGMVTQMMEDLGVEKNIDQTENFTFEPLPEKTINGFLCKGVKATSDEYEMVMYFTQDTEISFDDIYKNSKSKIPDALKDYFKSDEKSLMISMDIINLKNDKHNAKMECLGLEEVQKTINKSDYKFM